MLNVCMNLLYRVDAVWQEWKSLATKQQREDFWKHADELHADVVRMYGFVEEAKDDIQAMAMIMTSIITRLVHPETVRAITNKPLNSCVTAEDLAAFTMGGSDASIA